MNQLPSLPTIIGIGTATPDSYYSQSELLEIFQVKDRKLRALFLRSHINKRHLILPPLRANGFHVESQDELLAKHRVEATKLGSQAVVACLNNALAKVDDIRYLCCVTTTGFLTPGLSALLIRDLGIAQRCARVDIVGMGCNAGLNGLNVTANWTRANPGKLAVMVCVEICSAAYVVDESPRTAVVNSLFGDGAAAITLRVPTLSAPATGCEVVSFASWIVPDALHAMRFDWDSSKGKFSFYLDPMIPYVIGANVESVVQDLLEEAMIRRSAVAHWVVHSGGKKVIDAIKVNLGLSAHDLRHTTEVLMNYGNVSSGSFLFSFERLVAEKGLKPGENIVMITMGPGSTIETALLQVCKPNGWQNERHG